MSNNLGIVQVGASGPVAEVFRSIVARPGFPFKLEAVTAVSAPGLVGKRLGETALNAPASLSYVPIIDLDDAINNTDSPVVFSSLQSEVAAAYEDRLARGRVLATNASALRMRDDVALFNAYIGGPQLKQLFKDKDRPGYIIANGNCTAIILSVALEPLYRHIGISSLQVETLQGWSGAGKKNVPRSNIGMITAITSDEKDKIETEPNKFLGSSMSQPANIRIRAIPNRAPWVDGHHELVTVLLDRPTTRQEIEAIWRAQRAPAVLRHVHYGHYSPKRRPIKLVNSELLHSHHTDYFRQPSFLPMRVRTHLIEVDDNLVTFEIVGDNLGLGAAGASAMNLVYAKEMGYL